MPFKRVATGILALALILELALQTIWRGDLGVYLQPIVYLVAMALLLLSGFMLVKEDEQRTVYSPDLRRRWLVTGMAFFINMLLFKSSFDALGGIITSIEIDPLNSDVLPAIQLYVRRFLAGEWAYAPMEFPGWTVIPNYLPMVWMPFIIPEWLDIDYRWWPFIVFTLYSLYYWYRVFQTKDLSLLEYGLKSVLPLLLLKILISHEPTIFAHTSEIMVATFYLILCETVLSKRPWLAAIGVVICLMSRYSFGFWLPFYILTYWYYFGFKKLLQFGSFIFIGILIIYVIPFMFEDPLVYAKGMKYYMLSAEGEWVRHGWQKEGARPYHLGRGFGFAVYVYDFINGDVPFKLKVIQMLNASTSLITIIAIGVIGWLMRAKIKRPKLFLIFALKAYIMVFYSFIHVPYAYLYTLPLLLSLPLVLRVNFGSAFRKETSELTL